MFIKSFSIQKIFIDRIKFNQSNCFHDSLKKITIKIKSFISAEIFRTKMEKEISTKILIKELFVEWSLVSTSHGWPSIFRVKRFYLKVMWAICFLASTGYCGFLVIMSIYDYLEYQVVTKIRLVSEKPVTFPAVTICNLNPFVTPEANQFILDYFSNYYGYNFTNQFDFNDYFNEKNASIMQTFERMRQKVAEPNFGDSEKQKFGLNLENFISECYFNNIDCNMSEFRWYYSNIYGNCYTFNSGKDFLRKTYQFGEFNGLKLVINIGDQKENLFFSERCRRKGIYLQSVLYAFT